MACKTNGRHHRILFFWIVNLPNYTSGIPYTTWIYMDSIMLGPKTTNITNHHQFLNQGPTPNGQPPWQPGPSTAIQSPFRPRRVSPPPSSLVSYRPDSRSGYRSACLSPRDLSAPNHSAGAPGFTGALLPLRNRSIRASGPFGVLKSLGLKRSKPPCHFRPVSTPPWAPLCLFLFSTP